MQGQSPDDSEMAMTILQGRINTSLGASPLDRAVDHADIKSDLLRPSESRVRLIVIGSVFLVGIICLAAKLLYPYTFLGNPAPASLLHWLLPRLKKIVSGWSLASMICYPLLMLAILLLERMIPAVPTQKTFGTGFVYDTLWELMSSVTTIIVAKWYSVLLFALYLRYLRFLTPAFTASIPELLRFVLAVALLDFVRWLQHLLQHKVKWLWPFHAVHHAQREMNLFSSERLHIVDTMVAVTFGLLFLLVAGLSEPHIVWWFLIASWHGRLYHANIKAGFGPLRYLIVTPQSHRIHHSKRREHYDANYGGMFSVWDYLFGTQIRDYEIYPESGIEDESFPVETTQSVTGVFATFARELLYPFQCLWANRRRSADAEKTRPRIPRA